MTNSLNISLKSSHAKVSKLTFLQVAYVITSLKHQRRLLVQHIGLDVQCLKRYYAKESKNGGDLLLGEKSEKVNRRLAQFLLPITLHTVSKNIKHVKSFYVPVACSLDKVSKS